MPPGAASPPEIHDIQPPVEIPVPLWLLILGGIAGLRGRGLCRLAHRSRDQCDARRSRRPRRALALRALEELRKQVHQLDPYAFSIAVSDVLRHFIGEHFGLWAEQQTSPEFLASIQDAPAFSEEDRTLLADFLERCDLVKFARIDANEATSEALLASAFAFVQGGGL